MNRASSQTGGDYVHATAFVVGEAGVLVRGASGAGKSRLTLRVMAEAGRRGTFARLVGDDRVAVAAVGGRVVARGHPAVAGQIEDRGRGIVAVPHLPACVVRVVIDLLPGGPPRVPADAVRRTALVGIELPHLVLAAGLAEVPAADVLERICVEASA